MQHYLGLEVLLQRSHKGLFLLGGLEASMTELTARVDKLQLDLLQGSARSMRNQGLAEGQNTLFHTNTSTLDHNKILLDNTIMRESAKRGDAFGRQVKFGAARGFVLGGADAIDFLVHLRAVMIAVLTGTGNGIANASRMP